MSAATMRLFTSDGFLVGLAVGLAVPVVSAMWSRRRPQPFAYGGLLVAGAILTAIDVVKGIPDRVTIGVIVLALAGLLLRRQKLLAAIGVVLGAWLVVSNPGVPVTDGSALLTALAIVVGAPLVASFDDEYGTSAVSLPLLAITSLGILVTLPTTEFAIVATGVLLTAAVAGWPLRLARLGPSGAMAVVGILMWVTLTGGQTRPGAVVGGVASLGLLAAEPAIRALLRSETTLIGRLLSAGPTGVAAVVFGHGAVVLFAARVAGLQQEFAGAALLVVPMLVVAGLIVGGRPQSVPKPE